MADPVRAIVINLPERTDRLAFQLGQAETLGIALEVLTAVTVTGIVPDPGDACWTRWQRPLRDVEKATLLSHAAAWRRVLAEDAPLLVLEDDAWLMPDAPDVVARARGMAGIEHLSLETRGRGKVLGAAHPDMPGLRRLWLDRSGAAAYLLWPGGARRLLARAEAVPALADAVLVETTGLLRWQAVPAQAIQLDMAGHYGRPAPIPVESAISTVVRPVGADLRHRLRRIGAQLRMGAVALRPGTKRQQVFPDFAGGQGATGCGGSD